MTYKAGNIKCLIYTMSFVLEISTYTPLSP